MQKVSFMSQNSDKYPNLKGNNDMISKIVKVEESINKESLKYISKEMVPSIEDRLQDGDIILFVTGITGLDISHLGLIRVIDGKRYLLHASSSAKRVVLTKETLSQYTIAIKSQIGILVGRLDANRVKE